MNTEKWEILLKAIDSGSLSAAAAENNYTTSGVSRIITTLEEEIGFPLLIRRHQGVAPTPECKLLLQEVRNLLHAQANLTQKVAQLNGLAVGNLSIGTAYSSSYPMLTRQVVQFVQQYPDIKVEVLWGCNSELRQAVQERRMDLCLVSYEEDNLAWFPLLRDRMVVLVSRQHPLAGQTSFPIKRLSREPYIAISPNEETDASRLLHRYGVEPNTKFTTSDRYAAHEMVRAGLGVTLLNETQLLPNREGLCALPLSPFHPLELGMAYLPHPTLATQRFIEFWQQGQ